MSTTTTAGVAPIAAADCQIDGARYVERSWADAEREAVWRKTWLIAGLASDVTNVGDTITSDVGVDSVIIARTEDGLAAYHNACTHRGTRLLEEGVIATSQIRCPYHAWCFNLDGTLKSAPNAESFIAGLPDERLALKPVLVDVWKGIVFINMDRSAEPLEQFLGPMVQRLAPYNIEGMTLLEDQTAEVECNWKAIIDNFAELYHVDYIHPQHKSFVDCTGEVNELYPNGHTGLHLQGFTTDSRYPVPNEPTDAQIAALRSVELEPSDFVGRVPDIPDAICKAKRAQSRKRGYDYDPFSDEELTRVWQYNLFPNIILSGTCEGLWIMRSRPHPTDPEKSFMDKWSLTLEPDPALGGEGVEHHGLHAISDDADTQTSSRVNRDVFHYSEVLEGRKSLTITVDQDLSLLARVQAGARSAGFSQAWLSERESRVAHFHRELNQRLASQS